MKSAVVFGLCALLGTLVFTPMYANPVSEQRTDRSQQLMDHLVNLKAHVQSPLVRKLLEAVKESASAEDANVAVFIQNLLDSQSHDINDQNTFGRKEAEAAFVVFQSLPEVAQAQLVFTTLTLIAVPVILAIVSCLGCLCGFGGGN